MRARSANAPLTALFFFGGTPPANIDASVKILNFMLCDAANAVAASHLASLMMTASLSYSELLFVIFVSFRGLIFGILVKNSKDKIIVPLFISSILFGLMHLVNIRNQPLGNTIIQVLGVMAFGLFAAVVYMKTSNLIFAIVVHAMNDFMACTRVSTRTVSPKYGRA